MLGRQAAMLALAGALAASGCISFDLGGPTRAPQDPYTHVGVANLTGVPTHRPSTSEFYHLQVWGSERAIHISGPELEFETCHAAWKFTANRTMRTIAYHEALRPTVNVSRLGTVYTFNLWGVHVYDDRVVEGCPSVYEIRGFPSGTPYPTVNRTMGAFGAAEITVYPEGPLAFDPVQVDKFSFVPLGQKLIVSYGRVVEAGSSVYFVQGGFELANLGAWPKDRLVAGASGTVSRGPG